MTKKPESKLQKRIQQAIQAEYPSAYVRKTHGGIYSSGDPDLVACVQGLHFGFEVKMPNKQDTLTALQAATLNKILNAGGVGEMIINIEEALLLIDYRLHDKYVPSRYIEVEGRQWVRQVDMDLMWDAE